MMKAFSLIAKMADGKASGEVGFELPSLVAEAKAARASGLYDGKPCAEVCVLSSMHFRPVYSARCEKPVVAKPKAK
jgi:hypothetical protein